MTKDELNEVLKKQLLKKLPPRKYRVWISSTDDYLFQHEDYFEVTSESYDEIEKIAREFAFEHVDWGFEEVEDDD